MFNPKSILITGGAGFIGANFIRWLLSQTDATIVNVDKLTYAANLAYLSDINAPNYHFVKASITDTERLDALFAEYQFDCVINFAAESHVDRSISGPMAFVETNIVGTAVLLEMARHYWQNRTADEVRFHHVSTDEVFGSLALTDSAFNEQTAYDPSSPYSASKASSDHLVRAWHRTYQLPVTLSNCSNNYGPGQHEEKLIPTVIRNACAGKSIPVYGDGTNRRDWLFVIDHCEAIWQIIKQGANGQTYTVGGGVELSNNEVVRLICAQLDQRYPAASPHADLIEYIDDRAGHDWRYAIDCSKINQTLNWQAKHDFASAIEKTIDYYTAQSR
ncbi:dTDP-glucose 4,6-dehydratase [Ostreibacterium oceani]|uniref:dTDP-glucose 4,6-dehydratase n=1 Tax=Ostreibacterium oceani TaxID=2654998 RepID=A0A6N7ETH6_9GAMM|nr:dTDP-glucose 4,6-dehydratase [Ostreibacterium oceani]MPV85732.1 dTDP-glucose 4,6-dehydratase [Ostreibacterium oceani]